MQEAHRTDEEANRQWASSLSAAHWRRHCPSCTKHTLKRTCRTLLPGASSSLAHSVYYSIAYFRVPDSLAHEMNMDLLLITDDSHRMSRNKMNNNKQPFLGFLFLWSYLARSKPCTGCTMRKALLPLRAASTSHKKIKLVPKATPERVRQQGFIIRSTWFFILSESYILVYVWEVVSPFYRSSMLLLSY